ncbi:hypothetical protein ACH5RR_014296 [Cinchona calisaya]|uniref:RING-type E3 ubiquitin transferase n=1 Tax=Cinchona calisaya TaxID=153742 RepID=A0ABD3A2J6_9GENT
MASTPTETATDQHQSPPPSPSLEEIAGRIARAILRPSIVGNASSATPRDRPLEISVIVDSRTGSISMIGGFTDVEGSFWGKEGRLPASKASIEAMPVVKVAEEGLDCTICLAEFEVGEEAKQMPCKHRFHTGCIDEWLAIQGSCPVCRYRMPVEVEDHNNYIGGGDGSDEEAEEAGGGNGEVGSTPTYVFHIYFGRRRPNSNSGLGSTGDAAGSSTQDMEVDSGSSSH